MPTIDNYLVSSVSGLFGRTNNNKPSVFMITEGKNLGKANATSAKEQAILEATSKYNHKIEREGYIEIDNSIGLTLLSLVKITNFTLLNSISVKLEKSKVLVISSLLLTIVFNPAIGT